MGALKQFLIGVAEEMGLDPADPDAMDEARKRLSKYPRCTGCGEPAVLKHGLCDPCHEDMWIQYKEIEYTKKELDDMEREYREERELEEGVKKC